jgi:hypothetical protein
MMLLKRSYQQEIMDDFSIVEERITEALNELKFINKYLGGNKASKEGLKKISRQSKERELKILDLGGGISDILTAVKEKFNLKIFNIDINKGICRRGIGIEDLTVINGDVTSLPFKKNSFDIVHASLFFHHFREAEIKEILSDSFFIATSGVIINDLRRNIIAWGSIKVLTKLFSSSDMVINDAPLSVKRGFTKNEWKEILNDFKIKYEIKRRWAFRWLIVIYIDK